MPTTTRRHHVCCCVAADDDTRVAGGCGLLWPTAIAAPAHLLRGLQSTPTTRPTRRRLLWSMTFCGRRPIAVSRQLCGRLVRRPRWPLSFGHSATLWPLSATVARPLSLGHCRSTTVGRCPSAKPLGHFVAAADVGRWSLQPLSLGHLLPSVRMPTTRRNVVKTINPNYSPNTPTTRHHSVTVATLLPRPPSSHGHCCQSATRDAVATATCCPVYGCRRHDGWLLQTTIHPNYYPPNTPATISHHSVDADTLSVAVADVVADDTTVVGCCGRRPFLKQQSTPTTRA
jgi:hypothetical protein